MPEEIPAVHVTKGDQVVTIDSAELQDWLDRGFVIVKDPKAVAKIEATREASAKEAEDTEAARRALTKDEQRIRAIVRDEIRKAGIGLAAK